MNKALKGEKYVRQSSFFTSQIFKRRNTQIKLQVEIRG